MRLNGSWEFVGSYDGAVGCSAFMRTLDVFVLPSFAEGTSKSVIEAMAHGLPIITTSVGDPALRKRMGQAARDRYLKLFAPNAVLSMLVDTYARVAGRNGHVSQNGHHPWSIM